MLESSTNTSVISMLVWNHVKKVFTAYRMYESSSKESHFYHLQIRRSITQSHQVDIDIIRVVVKNSGSGQEYIQK